MSASTLPISPEPSGREGGREGIDLGGGSSGCCVWFEEDVYTGTTGCTTHACVVVSTCLCCGQHMLVLLCQSSPDVRSTDMWRIEHNPQRSDLLSHLLRSSRGVRSLYSCWCHDRLCSASVLQLRLRQEEKLRQGRSNDKKLKKTCSLFSAEQPSKQRNKPHTSSGPGEVLWSGEPLRVYQSQDPVLVPSLCWRRVNRKTSVQLHPDMQAARGTVLFVLNGKEHKVSPDRVPVDTRLVDYLRYHVHATGTKVMCREGGCGACIVVASAPDLDKGARRVFSVQACQLLVYACNDWEIQTIEYLGDRYSGYHRIQQALAGFYGTQCGYCSPGMCMTMYGETQRKGALTAQQVEEALDGNICRCTGYRPILDAFKSLALDATPKLKTQLADIEEAYKSKCPRTGELCAGKLSDGDCRGLTKPTAASDNCSSLNNSSVSYLPSIISSLFLSSEPTDLTADSRLGVSDSTARWFYPVSGKGVMNALRLATPQDNVLLVAGNTGSGVFKNDGPYTMFISLDKVPEMQKVTQTSTSLKVGARVPLSTCIDAFRAAASGPSSLRGYAHLNQIADHWQVVANTAVRNNGSWAGNLMLKNRHNDFPSDVFLTLSVCDATLLIGNAVTGKPEHLKVIDFPAYDMTKKVIVGMSIPPMPANTQIRTFKITPRAVNAHAYVNTAMRLPLNAEFMVTSTPTLLFGGLGGHFVSASKTEQFLVGKRLSEERVVQEAARRLADEAVPAVDPHQGSVEYRQSLVQSLFYKAVVSILRDRVSRELRSAGEKLKRGLNSGQQDFDANSDTWPIGQAIPKIESLIQVSGEAEYGDDVPLLPGELHGQFVVSHYADARIDRVDASQALSLPGVVDFVTAADIAGKNSYYAQGLSLLPKPDILFAVERTIYHSQPIGLVVAEDRDTAHAAAKLVTVSYSDIKKPVLHAKDALKHNRVRECVGGDGKPYEGIHLHASSMSADQIKMTHQIKGEMEVNTQYHFPMELVIARAIPIEDGYDIVCSTQFPNETQSAVAAVLNVPANSINLSVRRLGGAFGVKISRCNLAACAVAVAAAKTRRPVRVFMDLQTSMAAMGWREPYYATYDVTVDSTGKFKKVNVQMYSNTGHVDNESSIATAALALHNVYDSPVWKVVPKNLTTDCAANTWCRAPGHPESIAIVETIIEHVAAQLNMDPLAVREINLLPDSPDKGPNVFKNSILPLLKEKADIDRRKRRVAQFNKENRWRKRGLSVTPLRYDFPFIPYFRYTALVAIYAHDGTVAISHGGIEMGQGINTKVAQVAAAILGVPMDLIKIKPTNTVIGANSMVTGGSYGTDTVCHVSEL
ncbi:CO dehydrogenase flavoprotein C-terminal [Trinorchestia longiramus]|nr:CO dehydrogenase flavoprotein C-terminal [Trinorchestia longiramus]